MRLTQGTEGTTMESGQFDLNIFDYSSVAYCVVELVLDEAGRPADWIYRYCNQAFADIKEYRLDVIKGNSALSLSPQVDKNWMDAYYRAAYENTPCRKPLSIDGDYYVIIMPIGRRGFCSCTIISGFKTESAMENQIKIQLDRHKENSLNSNMKINETGGNECINEEGYVLNKLSPEYVSIYRIELNSGRYEILRLAANTNARKIVGDNFHKFATFDEYSQHYAECFILEEDKAEFLDWLSCKNMQKRLLCEDKITYHYHSVSKDGTHSFYEAYAVKGQVDGSGFNIFLAFRNIDSILYKEKAIQEQLKNALDEARLGNEIISAIAKTYQYISRIDIQADYYEEITNRSRANENYKKSGNLSVNNARVCKNLIAEEYQEAFLKFTDLSTLPERMKDEETIVMEYRMKDGNWHKLRFIEKKRDENGCLTHVLCVIRSISDAKKREQKLMYQVDEAKKEAALKTRFLSNMSHDIRTPMNGIIGMIDLANHYPDDLEIQKKCRDKILESSRHLVSLVNDILDMNKLESGDDIEQEINFDLADLLSKDNTEKQMQAADKNIDYVVDWDRSELKHIYLVGNTVYLQRLLSAVTDNAIKFTNPGGSVHVWCVEKASDDEHVTYEFGCSDNGIGMSEDFIGHAFELFSQENESSRSKYEGTGLGLAIAKKIADNLGGTIELKSKKGIGTTVVMTVPFKIGEPEKNEKIVEYGDVSVKGLRALVAEDNELNMEVAKFFLENNEVCVEWACDGLEAVERFGESDPGYYNVIFMDIMMPNMNGWDATRKIRSMKRPDAGSVPIIAMSANAFAEDIINSKISGMNVHITKPLSESKLIDALKECLS